MLAALLAGASGPAHADVLELDDKGVIHIRAQDQGQTQASLESIDPLDLPAEAVTQIGGSAAPADYAAAVEHIAALNHLSPALLEALVWQESRWQPQARSRAGAMGLAQLMPGTARDLGVDPRDPYANLAGGARYLRQQLDRFDGDIELALAAYNAGPGRVLRARGVPAIRETQSYVRAVVDRLARVSKQGR